MMRHGYYASVSYTDQLVGSVLNELDRLGLADNTIVIIWGDHGWSLGEHDFWGKHNTLNTSVRVPLIIRAPGKSSGKTSEALVGVYDIFPTLCELARLSLPASVQGRSFVSLLDNPTQSFRDVVYTRYSHGDAVVTDDLIYTKYDNGEEMLYDLELDPMENHNIVAKPERHVEVLNMPHCSQPIKQSRHRPKFLNPACRVRQKTSIRTGPILSSNSIRGNESMSSTDFLHRSHSPTISFLVTMLVACGLVPVSIHADETVSVACWRPHDFSFTASRDSEESIHNSVNCFRLAITGPDGKSFTIPGFYDGPGTWRIRVAPTSEGEWSLTTTSDVPELHGKTASFSCVKNPNPNINGVLRVDPNHPHHFVFADGKRFFMQGYEYDWLWALDMGKPGIPTIQQSLDLLPSTDSTTSFLIPTHTIRSGGRVRAVPTTMAHQNSFLGKEVMILLIHSRMNLDYWQHYDRVMAAMMERGIQAHILIKVYNKAVTWPEKGSPEEMMFFRWIIARYAAYPNVIWDFSKEAHLEKDLVYKQNCLKAIREMDPYHHLVTVHDDDAANDSGSYDELTDFRTNRHHGNSTSNRKNSNRIGSNHDKILAQRNRRNWPVANVESDYEYGPGGLNDKTFGGAMTAEVTMRTLWDIAMAGGYTGYYYTYTAWDVVRPLDQPRGYAYMKHFGEFWRGTEYWKLEPSDQLVSDGYCVANPGQEYVAYQSKAQSFTLNLVGNSAKLTGQWFNPLTGERTPAGQIKIGRSTVNPPDDWGDAPIILACILNIRGKP